MASVATASAVAALRAPSITGDASEEHLATTTRLTGATLVAALARIGRIVALKETSRCVIWTYMRMKHSIRVTPPKKNAVHERIHRVSWILEHVLGHETSLPRAFSVSFSHVRVPRGPPGFLLATTSVRTRTVLAMAARNVLRMERMQASTAANRFTRLLGSATGRNQRMHPLQHT